MSDLERQFTQAQNDAKTLTKRPSNADLGVLYGAYKQAVQGDVEGRKPGRLDFMGRGKYEAWERFHGQSPEQAMQAYVDKVTALLPTHRG
jgi:acyl-CoA-binding protein